MQWLEKVVAQAIDYYLSVQAIGKSHGVEEAVDTFERLKPFEQNVYKSEVVERQRVCQNHLRILSLA